MAGHASYVPIPQSDYPEIPEHHTADQQQLLPGNSTRISTMDSKNGKAVTEASSNTSEDEAQDLLTSPLAKRVVRKIDFWIIPLLFVTYNFNFMDKTILSSASVFGLKDSTDLHGTDYSWV